MNAITHIQRQLAELRQKDLSNSEIAERLGIDDRAIQHQIKKLRDMGVNVLSRAQVTQGEGWTPERVEKLKAMHAEGHSAGQIAKVIGGGLSRNAVIGKIHRMGLQRAKIADHRPQPPRPPQASVTLPGGGQKVQRRDPNPLGRRKVFKDQPPDLPVIDLPRLEAFKPRMGATPGVSLMMLSSKTCRWPIGDPGTKDFCFCGTPPRETGPYCEYHARISYQPLYSRAKRQPA